MTATQHNASPRGRWTIGDGRNGDTPHIELPQSILTAADQSPGLSDKGPAGGSAAESFRGVAESDAGGRASRNADQRAVEADDSSVACGLSPASPTISPMAQLNQAIERMEHWSVREPANPPMAAYMLRQFAARLSDKAEAILDEWKEKED
jgi:hypothetical protein